MKHNKRTIFWEIIKIINSGEFDKEFFSENQLSIKYKVSRSTIRETLKMLKNLNIIESFKGSGYLVKNKRIIKYFLKNETLSKIENNIFLYKYIELINLEKGIVEYKLIFEDEDEITFEEELNMTIIRNEVEL